MIDIERMNRIIIDLTVGNPVVPETPEEEKFIRETRREIRQIKADGQIVEIPPE